MEKVYLVELDRAIPRPEDIVRIFASGSDIVLDGARGWLPGGCRVAGWVGP